MITKNLTVTKVASQQQQQYRASVCSWRGVSTNLIRDTKVLWPTAHKLFSTLESVKANSCYAHPPEGCNPKILTDGRRVVRKVRKALLGLRTSPRWGQDHLSGKLKHSVVHDERDPCLFVNTELHICIGVHEDDMLAVGPSELTKNLLPELAKDTAMRWSMVTDKPQVFFGLSLCRRPQGYTFGVSCDYVTKLCKDLGFGELKGSNTLIFEKLIGGACEGIATRDQWSKMCNCSHAVHGQLSSSGIRETQGCESTHSPCGHECFSLCKLGRWNLVSES